MSSPEEANNLKGTPIPAETHPIPAFPCPQCQRRFQSRAALLRHSNGHHPAHDRCPIQCRLCPFLTTRYKAFLQHRRECHPKSAVYYCCPLCNRMFSVLGKYYEHCLVHMASNDYEGFVVVDQDVAGVENSTMGSLEDSLEVLRDAEPLELMALPDLPVEITSPEIDLSKSSKVVHPTTSIKPIESFIVKKPLSIKGSMASVVSRPPETPQQPDYQCPYCSEKSQVPNWLQVHIYMCHGAVAPTAFKAKCGHCELVENDPEKLHRHYRDQHADLPMTYRCPTCGKNYRKLFFYAAHYKSHQLSQVLEKHGLPKDIETPSVKEAPKTFTCPECSEACTDLIAYESHLQSKHTEISIDSNHDAESSTLSANSLYGPPTNPEAALKCPLCPRTFDDATLLLSHQEICLLNRGLPAVEPPEIISVDDDDDVILVKNEIDTYLNGARWYKEVVIPRSKVYSCAECDQRFDSLALVERHTVTVHCPTNLALLYKCTKCEETFEGFGKFQKHSLKHI